MDKLLFEKSKTGRRCVQFPQASITEFTLPKEFQRKEAPRLPEIAEVDLVRHYINLSKKAFGVDNGFYPLGSCTMKYNPRINEDTSSLFKNVHPYQDSNTIQGVLSAMKLLEEQLKEITGMDAITLQPAAGAHGEFTGLLLIRAYHEHNKDYKRTKVIVPDSAHGTNPASSSMVGYDTISVKSDEHGNVDIEELRKIVNDEVAALMLTNPNTLGLFDHNIQEITKIIHDAGGLVYYDGANLNAVMGICKPKDMGFDVIHLNLHKTFGTPHGAGGPGSGPVGCIERLEPFLPKPVISRNNDGYYLEYNRPLSIGRIRSFYGNFAVYMKALTYILILGSEGIREVSENAVLNANYMMEKLNGVYHIPYYKEGCMHEFVLSIEDLKKDHDITAKDIAKALLDYGIHPPTMYFPLIVSEALMIEPNETESKETLDHAIDVFLQIYEDALHNPEKLKSAPISTPVGRLDEVTAARHPILRYSFE